MISCNLLFFGIYIEKEGMLIDGKHLDGHKKLVEYI